MLAIVAAAIYTALSLTAFAGSFKLITVVFCLAGAAIQLLKAGGGRLKERFSFPVAAMAAYMLFVAVSAAWASAGKFFIREYSKLLFAFAVYLFALLCLEKTKKSLCAFLTFLSACSAIYAVLSVDMATLKIFKPLLNLIPEYDGIDTGFETGTRLTGIFGNAIFWAACWPSAYCSIFICSMRRRAGQKGYYTPS